MTKYRHEAGEQRRILFERGSGMCATWRNFRQFLADMGPAPSPDHLVTRVTAGDLTYGPGKCAWIHRDRQPAYAGAAQPVEPAPARTFGHWASVNGQPVEYAALARRLGVPFEAMAVALRNGQAPDELVQQASLAESLMNQDVSWLPPERRDAFFTAFRMWHMQVQPRFAAAATPAFLYLYSALPGMIQCRNGLADLGLWNPPTDLGRRKRSAHPLWRRFCDAMTRAEAARVELEIYKQYSLTSQIDELWDRIKAAEERFRTGGQSRPPKAA